MKKFRLFTTLLIALFISTSLMAQRHSRRGHHKEYDPAIYLISVHEVDTLMNDCQARQELALLNRLSAESAIADHQQTTRQGWHQPALPEFILASRGNRFSLAVGGAIVFKTNYDFEGIVDSREFRTSAIPMSEGYNNRQQLLMDATSSYLYLKAIGNTRLGRVVVYVDANFKGGESGSYTPHVRSAYVSMGGFTAGRDITTFCDITAAAPTIDYRGPNAYNSRYTTLLRYEHSMWRDIFSFGLAAEMPEVSATYGDYFAPLRQRMPDFPIYLQVAWGSDRASHIRASGVFRNMYARNLRTGNNTSLFGWGAQISGHIRVVRPLELFFNGIYGQGITPYINDLMGSGMDFTPNPASPESLQAIPALAWQAAARINILPNKLCISGGYSTAQLNHRNGYYSATTYRRGQYIFGNMFWSVTNHLKLGLEYLYGSRENMNEQKSHANRASMMIKYSF